jgi:hypothetical protein
MDCLTTTNSQAAEPPLVSCPRQLIQSVRSYPPHMEAVSSTYNLTTHHAVLAKIKGYFKTKVRKE